MAADTIPQRPYLLRAMHEWMTDNGQTPHLVIDASHSGAIVPREHVRDGKIVLNVSYAAAHNLDMSNDGVMFAARFGGQTQRITVPIEAILGIYARETGQGMIFADQSIESDITEVVDQDDLTAEPVEAEPVKNTESPRKGDRSHLRVIK